MQENGRAGTPFAPSKLPPSWNGLQVESAFLGKPRRDWLPGGRLILARGLHQGNVSQRAEPYVFDGFWVA